MKNLRLSVAAALALTVIAASLDAQPRRRGDNAPQQAAPPATELKINESIEGRLRADAPTVYRYVAAEDGALAVLVRSETDVNLAVLDRFGQDLLGGMGDMDWQGQMGSEQAILPMRAGQEVRIELSSWADENAKFTIAAGLIAVAQVAPQADAQGDPDQAVALPLNQPQQADIDPAAGQSRDWFTVTPDRAGYLTVIVDDATPAPAPPARNANPFADLADQFNPNGGDMMDLALEAFTEGAYREPIAYSDGDVQGNMALESITLRVEARQPLYLRVTGNGGKGRYVIRAMLLPEAPAAASLPTDDAAPTL